MSPGGVGFGISCAVRLLAADLHAGELAPRLDQLMDGWSGGLGRCSVPGGR